MYQGRYRAGLYRARVAAREAQESSRITTFATFARIAVLSLFAVFVTFRTFGRNQASRRLPEVSLLEGGWPADLYGPPAGSRNRAREACLGSPESDPGGCLENLGSLESGPGRLSGRSGKPGIGPGEAVWEAWEAWNRAQEQAQEQARLSGTVAGGGV